MLTCTTFNFSGRSLSRPCIHLAVVGIGGLRGSISTLECFGSFIGLTSEYQQVVQTVPPFLKEQTSALEGNDLWF